MKPIELTEGVVLPLDAYNRRLLPQDRIVVEVVRRGRLREMILICYRALNCGDGEFGLLLLKWRENEANT